MVYAEIPARHAGVIAEMQALMAAVETLADALRRIADGIAADEAEESPAEDKDKNYVNHRESSCDLPSLPKHQIPWFTSGFQ